MRPRSGLPARCAMAGEVSVSGAWTKKYVQWRINLLDQEKLVRTARVFIVLASFAIVLTACGGTTTAIVTESPGDVNLVLESNPDAVLLDIRTPEEVDEVRIPGAVTIDFYATDFADQIAGLDRDTTYVVYCRSGNRSSQSESVFADLGFTDVHMVDGGIVAWANAGLPIEQ